MGIKKYVFFLLLFIAIIESCNKPCHEPDHNFSVSEIFSPEKDSVDIGDTIWIICNIPKPIKDINSGALIPFEGANLSSNLVISNISVFHSISRGAIDSFEYISFHGELKENSNIGVLHDTRDIFFEETKDAYLFQVGIVPIKAGLYIFTIPDDPIALKNGSNTCGKGNFRILNANVNKHLYLFENLWGPLSDYDSAHSYCVKVK